MPLPPSQFRRLLSTWYKKYGRKELPWQKNKTAYRVWISEIMLQQTQVKTVIPYYNRFMKAFPTLKQLALAKTDEVLHLWTGLGYYSRARNLHRAAQIIYKEYNGRFPRDLKTLQTLPGIGRSTAGAILSFSSNQSAPILDGNVKRVFIRFHAIQEPMNATTIQTLWNIAETYLPKTNASEYNQTLMDIGAMICTSTKPKCDKCPLKKHCLAVKHQLTDQLPLKKSKKSLPKKESYFLIIQNEQKEVLLEKRAPTGIWGGLWSFPEITNKKALHDYLKKNGLIRISEHQAKSFQHTFSHFHLKITPIYLKIRFNPRKIMENSCAIWHNPKRSFPHGLPQPIKKLLETLS